MRRLLALDQASHISGWAVFEDDKLIKYGKFVIDEEDIGERLEHIRNNVANLISTYNINEVAFEDIQMQSTVGNNVQTFKVLAEVFGVIYELVTELRLPHTAVLASVWKSTLGIKGKQRAEQKRNAQAYVTNTYGIKATQDESDAICIGSHILTKKIVPTLDGFDWSE